MNSLRKSQIIRLLFMLILTVSSNGQDELVNQAPIADAGLPRYAATAPVQLDGSGSYDPDGSGPLTYTWTQISGPAVVVSDANTHTPIISGFVQTDEIQQCEFELIVNDGTQISLSDTVSVIIVPAFSGSSELQEENPPFDASKSTVVYFGGGDCISGGSFWGSTTWYEKANVLSFSVYEPDAEYEQWRTYYHTGDMLIVYLSSVAVDYNQPIQTIGWSTGGQPAIDAAIRMNRVYQDARYVVNRVTHLDVPCRYVEQSKKLYQEVAELYLTSSVEGEQCWLENYYGPDMGETLPNALQACLGLDHVEVRDWYINSLSSSDANVFNNGVVGGAYWSVIGPGKNLQLSSHSDEYFFFAWTGNTTNGQMRFYNEPKYPARLPEPVTLVGPENGSFVDANGAVFSCEESENTVGYQLLFGPDPYRVMDYYVVSDTLSPPSEVITSSPFEPTWWTVKAYDQYGSTIYADPIRVNFENIDPLIENITIGKRYGSFRHAIDDARNGHKIVVSPGVYQEKVNFKGKNLTLRSTDPNDSAVVSETIITADGDVVTFSGGEDENCVLAGFTITRGKRGIYCSGSYPTIINCAITGNVNFDVGAGMYIKDGSSPTLINCTFSDNSAVMGGGIQNVNSSPTLINCSFSGNSGTYSGGGISCVGGSPVLNNCILWNDTPEEISILSGNPAIKYSDIQGGFTGEGNINTDPFFADTANGDYHLKSKTGRWDAASQSWVIDEVSSPCIDAGDPITPVSVEPLPNGGIINMGAYGGTSEASKSP